MVGTKPKPKRKGRCRVAKLLALTLFVSVLVFTLAVVGCGGDDPAATADGAAEARESDVPEGGMPGGMVKSPPPEAMGDDTAGPPGAVKLPPGES